MGDKAKPIKTVSESQGVSTPVFYFTLAVVLAGGFLQGYFWPLQYTAVAFLILASSLVFFAWHIRSTWGEWRLTLPHGALIVLFIIFLLGLILPVSANFAIKAVLFWASVLGIYFVWSSRPLSAKQLQLLVDAVVTAGALLAAYGLAIYTRVVERANWLFEARIAAGFEYPNVTAGFFIMMLLLALHTGFWAEHRLRRFAYAFASVVLLAALFFTYSRGGWLVVAASLALLAVFNLRQQLLATLWHGLAFFAFGGVAISLVLRFSGALGLSAALGVALLGGLLVLIRPTASVKPIYRSVFLATLLLLVVVSASLAVMQRDFLAERLAWILNRLNPEFMVQDDRLVFFRDGLSVLGQSPVIGHGGGAWRALYLRVQSYHYGSIRMHSDPLEILLEVGLLGLAAYLLWVGSSTWAGLTSKNKQHEGLAFAVLGFAMHSSIDAFLGFPVFYYLVALMLAVIAPRRILLTLKPPKFVTVYGKTIFAGLALIITIISGMFWLAEAKVWCSVTPAAARGDHEAVIDALRRSLMMNPFDLGRRLDYAKQVQASGGSRTRVARHLLQTLRFEPHDPRVTNTLGNFYFANRDYSQAGEFLRRTLEQQPMNIQNYEILALVYLEVAVNSATRGLATSEYLASLATLLERHARAVQATDPRLLARSALPFTNSPVLAVSEGASLVLRGEWAKGATKLTPHIDSRVPIAKGIATVWLVRAYELLGKSVEAEALVAARGSADSFKQSLARARLATGGR